MKFLNKKNYIILFFLIFLSAENKVIAKNNEIQYTRENISSYFLGSISVSRDYNNEAYQQLKEIQNLKEVHSKYNLKFLRTLVLLERFEQAKIFAKNVWKEDEFFFEADLLLGLDYFLKKDYQKADKYFKRLNKISQSNFFWRNFFGNILMTWNQVSLNDKEQSLQLIQNIPEQFYYLKKIQEVFLLCHYDDDLAEKMFKELVKSEDYNFSRYNFFLANYFLSKKRTEDAEKIITSSRREDSSNLLLKQSEGFLKNGKSHKLINFFDCKNPEDIIAEFFYVIASIYSSEKDYILSNFYLKISLYLNDKFLPNKTLLAENYYYQKKYNEAQKIYRSLKSVGPVYSWYASRSIASILIKEKGNEYAVENLEKSFESLSNPNFENYFDLANFYKDNEYYEKSIKYYSLALDKINQDHFLVSKILHRRGTSFERLGNWKSAETDLLKSLEILPDQAHVLNYLAYSWIEKDINLDRGLEMLIKAAKIKENDGYIIDSLGWAYYKKKNYIEAEYFLRQALELMPLDPVINDHYGDTLWMLNKNIQARYFWKSVLQLDTAEEELKNDIKKKLIYGINKQL